MAYAPTESGFTYHMQKLKELGGKIIVDFVNGIPKEKYCNAYFQGKRFGIMSNSIAESFNSWILELRELPVFHIIEGIRCKMMGMFANRLRDSELWSSILCPTMEQLLHQNLSIGRHWKVTMSSEYVFEVDADFRVKVDLLARLCSCRMWQIKSFPCSHALIVIQQSSFNVYDYIEDCFKVSSFKSAYGIPIHPIPDIENVFVDESSHERINPPKTKKQPGRRKKRRIANVGEGCSTVTCSRCDKVGHNRASCSEII